MIDKNLPLPSQEKEEEKKENHLHPRRTIPPFSQGKDTLEEKKEELSPATVDTREEQNGKEALLEGGLSSAGNVFDWVKSFLFSLATVIFIFTLLFRGVTVDGGSMLPTLEDNDYLIISDLMYQPKTGDIVVVQSPHYKNGTEPLIKRVIATGGQIVKIDFNTWQVWVDGILLDEDYILKDTSFSMNVEDLQPDESGLAEVTVEENCIFVMGDNRNDSLDSRSEAVGQIEENYIMGRVVLRISPFAKFGKVE